MRLRELRLALGVSQKAIADSLGVSPTVYNRYEKGVREPSAQMLKDIASFFGVSVDYLISDNNDEVSRPSITDSDIKFALFGDPAADITDEQFEEIKRYAQYLREKRKHDKR